MNSNPEMLNDHPQRSEAKQVKKKLCMVCFGPEIDDCEILILDIESDLKDRSCDVEDDEVDDSDPVVLTPIAQLSQDLLGIETFSVLGSTLYMFEDGYAGNDDRGSILITDKRKSAYAYDFSSSTSSRVVKLERSNVRKLSDMCGPKAWTRAAAPTPDGKRIVVYSSSIQYDPFDDDNHIKRIDFEVYNADLNSWVKLPGLAEKFVEKYGKDCFTYYVDAFTFVNNSKMLILVGGIFFTFDLDDEEQVEWREVVDPDQWRVVDPDQKYYVCEDNPFFLLGLEGRVCVTPMAIIDTLVRRSFWLPVPRFADYSVTMPSAHITLLSSDSDGECTFARVHMGKSIFTDLPHLVVDVFTFNLDKYIKDTGADHLEIHFIKSSKFVVGTSGRGNFAGCDIFPILAGIDMSSAGVPFRLNPNSPMPSASARSAPKIFCPSLPDPERTGLRLILESNKTGACGLD